MSREKPESEREDAGIENLLRQVGAREEPSEETTHDVYAAVHAEWRAAVVERARKKRRVTWSIAAGVVAAAMVGSFLALKIPLPGPAPVASIVRVEGRLQVASEGNKAWATRIAGQTLAAGETVVTNPDARAALNFANGLSVRLDRGTKIEVMAKDRLKLDAGALYVDAKPSIHAALIVETAAGSVRHVGTQYAVRTAADGIEVSVREGRVSIANKSGIHTGQPGEKLYLTTTGEVTRTTLPPRHPDWQWATAIAPPFDIDGQPLASFLEWAARESGRKLMYASDEAQAAALQVKLHGSIEGLDLDTALATVLSTTQLRQYSTPDESIGIALAPAAP